MEEALQSETSCNSCRTSDVGPYWKSFCWVLHSVSKSFSQFGRHIPRRGLSSWVQRLVQSYFGSVISVTMQCYGGSCLKERLLENPTAVWSLLLRKLTTNDNLLSEGIAFCYVAEQPLELDLKIPVPGCGAHCACLPDHVNEVPTRESASLCAEFDRWCSSFSRRADCVVCILSVSLPLLSPAERFRY